MRLRCALLRNSHMQACYSSSFSLFRLLRKALVALWLFASFGSPMLFCANALAQTPQNAAQNIRGGSAQEPEARTGERAEIIKQKDRAQTIKDWVTAVALFLGTIGAAWKWIFAELLRRFQQTPTIDGTFSARCLRQDGQHVVVELRAMWRNRSTAPVFAETKETDVVIRELDSLEGAPISFLKTHENQEHPPVTEAYQVIRPLEKYNFYMLEPATESEIIVATRLPIDRIYAAQFRLFAGVEHQLARWRLKRLFKRVTGKTGQEFGVVSWARLCVFRTEVESKPGDQPPLFIGGF
jgi:hypothetical protein